MGGQTGLHAVCPLSSVNPGVLVKCPSGFIPQVLSSMRRFGKQLKKTKY
jgi:hypothetical protein